MGIYKELDSRNLSYFKGNPFYKISFENNSICKAFKSQFNKRIFDSDYYLFGRVKSIWGYYYREKEISYCISDGVIEQWEFENESTANEVLNKIQKYGHIVYFNTNPYFCKLDNKLFIFQSRSMAFSNEQKPLFEKFVKENNAITIYK